MAARHTQALAALTLALALGACGGEEATDETVVDETVAQEESAETVDSANAPPTEETVGNEVEDAAAEAGDAVDAAAAETEEALDSAAAETEEALDSAASETEDAVDSAATETEEAAESVSAETEEAMAGSSDELGEGWSEMQANWDSSAGMVKDRWAELTEEEILATEGDRGQLVSLVQERYGIEREQAEQEVNDWAATL